MLLTENFNPLPRKEGDALTDEFSSPTGNFNPLPRKEGDGLRSGFCFQHNSISIHSLVKRETTTALCTFCITPFQSTPS